MKEDFIIPYLSPDQNAIAQQFYHTVMYGDYLKYCFMYFNGESNEVQDVISRILPSAIPDSKRWLKLYLKIEDEVVQIPFRKYT